MNSFVYDNSVCTSAMIVSEQLQNKFKKTAPKGTVDRDRLDNNIAGPKFIHSFNGFEHVETPTRFSGPVNTNEPEYRWKKLQLPRAETVITPIVGQELARKTWEGIRVGVNKKRKEDMERTGMFNVLGVLPYGMDGIMGDPRSKANLGGEHKRPRNRVHEIATAQPRDPVSLSAVGVSAHKLVNPPVLRGGTTTKFRMGDPNIGQSIRPMVSTHSLTGAQTVFDAVNKDDVLKWNKLKMLPPAQNTRTESIFDLNVHTHVPVKMKESRRFNLTYNMETRAVSSGPSPRTPGVQRIVSPSFYTYDLRPGSHKMHITDKISNTPTKSQLALGASAPVDRMGLVNGKIGKFQDVSEAATNSTMNRLDAISTF